jgi:hypothetical protein
VKIRNRWVLRLFAYVFLTFFLALPEEVTMVMMMMMMMVMVAWGRQ